MSRKFRQDQSTWKIPSIQVFNVGYSSYRVKGVEAIDNALVWFYNSSGISDISDDDDDARHHPLYSSAGLLQDLLLRQQNIYRFNCVICIDLKEMCDDDDEDDENEDEDSPELSSYDKAIAREIEEQEITKSFGKKVLRLMHRLILQNAIVAGQGSFCAVLIKLYRVLYLMDPDIVKELWLLHPDIPTKFVNTHLVANEGNSVQIYESVKMNLIFQNKKNNRVGVLQYYFPSLQKLVISEPNNWFHIIAHSKDATAILEDDREVVNGSYDPECMNEIGERLFLAHMKVEMNPHSKQYERNSFDITDDLMEILEGNESNESISLENIDFSKMERHIGALVLRGNRCILVRSLDGEWDGMRIPSVPYEEEDAEEESPHEAAIRTIEEFADVDSSEVRILPHIQPVMVYAPNGQPILMELYPLYAVNPPPSGVSCEEMDLEDEEDLYDWYRFDNALARLNDEASCLAMKTMVHSLSQAARVGLVPNQWGGIFGQEYVNTHEQEINHRKAAATASTTNSTSCSSNEEH